jgi:hypothetical protein
MRRHLATHNLAIFLLGILFAATTARGDPLVPTGPYPLAPIYQSQIPGIGPLGLVTPGTTLSALAGSNVITVGLPGPTPSAPLYTQPATLAGGPAFPGGFAPSDGSYILTGATGPFLGLTFAGAAYLTPAAGGATSTLTVNGIFDATQRNSTFYASATHGPDNHGDSTGLYGGMYGSGIYALERSGGTLTGLDLLFDTGTYSGAVAADPQTGDVYFALGGLSATLTGHPHDYNDLWVLKAADIAAATGPGVISPLSADYVASIGTGFNDGINGLVFDPAGRLLVGLTDYTGLGIDRIARFDVDRSNPADYTSTYAGTVAEATRSDVRILDFVLDGDTLRITATPEPGTGLLLLAGLALSRLRRR